MVHEDNAAPLRLELNGNRTQILQRASNRFMFFARCVEHQETATACAEQFATDRSRFASGGIPCVDLRRTDIPRHAALKFPAFVQDLAKSIEVVSLQLSL